MTQDERRLERYNEVKSFIESNHRNPFRHNPEERFKYCNWLKHNKKLLNTGEMKEERVALFKNLLEMGEKYRRKNQYLRFLCFDAFCEIVEIESAMQALMKSKSYDG